MKKRAVPKNQQGKIPAEVLKAMLKIVNDSKGALLREEIAAQLIWDDPSVAKYFFTGSIPFGVMARQKYLEKITPELTLRVKRAMLLNATVDVSSLVAPSLHKITTMKKTLQKQGAKIMSNNSIGIINIDKADIETVGRKIYDILKWNYGQVPEWEECLKRMRKDHPNQAMVRRISSHGKTAMHAPTLRGLVDELRAFNDGEEE
jgi:hypothetical protein